MFENKIAWVTGASSGIGEAVAKELLLDGAKVVLSARRETELERVKSALLAVGGAEGDILVLPLDITDEAALASAVTTVIDRFGQIDFLFNNAGISQRSLCLETEMSTYRTLFEVDVFGQIALTKLVLPHMVARQSGHVAVTSSIAGKVGVKQRTGYCAVKHAMMGFFDALRAEVDEYGIKVTTVTPGFIRTAIAENSVKGDGSKFGKVDHNIAGGIAVEECAAQIMAGLKSGRPEILVAGKQERSAALLRRFWPSKLFQTMAKMPTV